MLIDRSFAQLSDDNDASDPLERRTTPRVALEADVTITIAGRVLSGISGNVSVGGLCVWTYCLLREGMRVALGFLLPAGNVLAMAVVRWRHEARPGRLSRMGLQFLDLDSADRVPLERFSHAEFPLCHR